MSSQTIDKPSWDKVNECWILPDEAFVCGDNQYSGAEQSCISGNYGINHFLRKFIYRGTLFKRGSKLKMSDGYFGGFAYVGTDRTGHIRKVEIFND